MCIRDSHEGDILSTYSIKQLHAVVQQFYEPLTLDFAISGNREVKIRIAPAK